MLKLDMHPFLERCTYSNLFWEGRLFGREQ